VNNDSSMKRVTTMLRMGCNFAAPFDHTPPVHHGGAQILLYEWPDECLWAQLQYERWQQGRQHDYTNTLYLANLEEEWARRAICSRCHRNVDPDLDQQMSALAARAQNAEEKLGRIRRLIAVTPDTTLRPEVMGILDEQ
jgi:hypothetical protein